MAEGGGHLTHRTLQSKSQKAYAYSETAEVKMDLHS